ncbi:MAG TPA: hypothetical protein VJ692_16535 [Nitrospiraceae bacterium]|nr:hypothetical protein [Nitrospiraceae bacterium]
MFAQLINILLGVWLMAAPDMIGYGDAARTNDHIAGPLIVSFAMIAISEVTRPVRWLNVALGFWLVVAPMLLGYWGRIGVHSAVIGLLVAASSLVRGQFKDRVGGGWKVLWRRNSAEC